MGSGGVGGVFWVEDVVALAVGRRPCEAGFGDVRVVH